MKVGALKWAKDLPTKPRIAPTKRVELWGLTALEDGEWECFSDDYQSSTSARTDGEKHLLDELYVAYQIVEFTLGPAPKKK